MKTKKAKLISQVHHGKRLALQERIPLATPLVVYIESSGYCNLRCIFCPHGVKGTTLKKDFMSVNLSKKLIDDLSVFPDKIELLRFCGTGDSLMNKNILEILQYAKEQKVAKRMELITNGILLTDDLIKNLPRFLDRIIISIEGLSSEEYQRITRTNINFQNLLNNLSTLYIHKGRCMIHIKANNEAVLSKSKKKTFFNMFSNYCDEIYIENLVPMWPQLDAPYFANFINEFRFGGQVAKRKVCPQIFKSLQVQADGEVLPCCVDWKRVNVLGDINKDSLFKIWNGKKLRKLQIEHLVGNKDKIEPCKDCRMNDYCELDDIDPYADKLYQHVAKWKKL